MTEQSNETPLIPLPPWAPEEPGYLILPSMMDTDPSNFSSSTVNPLSPIPPSSLIPPSPLLPDREDETNTEPLPSFKMTPRYIALPSPGSLGPSSPSSSGVTLSELLKGAHTQIRYLDRQVKELNDERVVFLRWLSKKDLEILTCDNTIKHLHCDLHGTMDHIQSIEGDVVHSSRGRASSKSSSHSFNMTTHHPRKQATFTSSLSSCIIVDGPLLGRLSHML